MNFNILGRINRLLGFYNGIDNYYTFQSVGDTTPEWVDTTDKFLIYQEIPELQSVINRYANMVASAKPIIKDSKGVIVDPNNTPYFKLLSRPNPMQSWSDFIFFMAVNRCVTNNMIALPNKGMIELKSVTPIAFNNVKIVPTGKSYKQFEKSGIIKEFRIPLDQTNKFETFKTEEVLYISIPDGINLFNSKSKIEALRYPLSNIAKTYEKRNVILRNMFALGILSSENNDGISSIPLDTDEAEQMRNDLMNRNKGKVIITDKNMKWSPMSYPTKDLMLFEEMTADKAAIIDAYGLNVNMFSPIDNQGQTYSNVEMGEKQAYRSTIIPDTEALYAEIGRQLGFLNDGYYLLPDFSHIDVLSENKNQEADTLLKNTQAISNLLNSGYPLTNEEIKGILGL